MGLVERIILCEIKKLFARNPNTILIKPVHVPRPGCRPSLSTTFRATRYNLKQRIHRPDNIERFKILLSFTRDICRVLNKQYNKNNILIIE